MLVFLCGNTFEEILCGVYDAWAEKKNCDTKLELKDIYEPQLFCEYRETVNNTEKADKVIRAIRNKLSEAIFEQIYITALSDSENKPDLIYHYLQLAFSYGKKIIDRIQDPVVYEIFSICRCVTNEANRYKEFVRFQKREAEGGVYCSTISPKQDVLVLIAPHFADRMPSENWAIYDTGRKKAVIHHADSAWFISNVSGEDDHSDGGLQEADEYALLWRAFFNSISIKERKNPRCQRNNLPIRFRSEMQEFFS